LNRRNSAQLQRFQFGGNAFDQQLTLLVRNIRKIGYLKPLIMPKMLFVAA
jgi:hypothetical protein